MKRFKVGHALEYSKAKEFEESLEEGVYQIRRKSKGFDIVKRVQGNAESQTTKDSTGYTKKRKRRKHVSY